jgi:hypothetical protein
MNTKKATAKATDRKARARQPRLSRDYYHTARYLGRVFASEQSPRFLRRNLRNQLNKLLRAAALDMDVLEQPGDCYLAAVRALIAQGEDVAARREVKTIHTALTAYNTA